MVFPFETHVISLSPTTSSSSSGGEYQGIHKVAQRYGLSQ